MEQVKEHQKNKKLSAAEIGDLFANYLGDSLFTCVFEHHLQVVEDNEVKDFIVFALDTGKKHRTAVSKIMRHDIHTQFATLTAGISKYGNEGMNIMINMGWLEELPTAVDREKLSKMSSGSNQK